MNLIYVVAEYDIIRSAFTRAYRCAHLPSSLGGVRDRTPIFIPAYSHSYLARRFLAAAPPFYSMAHSQEKGAKLATPLPANRLKGAGREAGLPPTNHYARPPCRSMSLRPELAGPRRRRVSQDGGRRVRYSPAAAQPGGGGRSGNFRDRRSPGARTRVAAARSGRDPETPGTH